MWQEMYLTLFRAVTKALEQMEAQNYGDAAESLKKAQCDAEEQYLMAEESNSAAV